MNWLLLEAIAMYVNYEVDLESFMCLVEPGEVEVIYLFDVE